MLHLVAGLGYDWACMTLVMSGADINLQVRQSVNQSLNQPINQSVSQSVNQSGVGSQTLLVCLRVSTVRPEPARVVSTW